MIRRLEEIFALHFCKYWFTSVLSELSVALCVISVNLKHFLVCLNSAVFKVFISENRKLQSILCLYLYMNQTWTAMRHRQMVNVAKDALNSKVFSPLLNQALKILPGYFLVLLSFI